MKWTGAWLLQGRMVPIPTISRDTGKEPTNIAADNYHYTSGIYLYRLTADVFSDTRTMVLVR